MAKEQERGRGGAAARGPYEGGGGAGGKLRTPRSTRRSATPYDRPQTGRHAPATVRADDNSGNNNVRNWLTRIIDPASRIIANSARRWLPSVFQNLLMAPPASQPNSDVHDDVLQEAADDVVENAMLTEEIDKEQGAGSVENRRNESQVAVLDELYKNKTISRGEFNRTIEFLKTKVVDDSYGMKDCEVQTREELFGGNEPINATNIEARRWHEERKKAREEKDNSFWDNRLFSNASSPVATQTVRDDAGSSPTDLAKAFMGVRSRRASTSALPMPRTSTLSMPDEITPNKLFGDERTPQRSSCNQLVSKTREGLVFGNGLADDRFKAAYDRHKYSQFVRSQSRVQGLSCPPSGRNSHQQPHFERVSDGLSTSKPAFQWTPIQSPFTGGRQRVKRRRPGLDDGLTSIETIRRTRQKFGFNTSLRNSNRSCSDGNQLSADDFVQNALTSAFRKPVETVKHKDSLSVFKYREDAVADMSASLVNVPQKSCETAQKIFEQLERMVPSPKENSEVQLAHAREKAPTSLSINMLDGHAHRRTETTLNLHVPNSSSRQKKNQSVAQGASGSGQKYEGKMKSPIFSSVQTFGGARTSSDTGDVARQNLNASSSKVHKHLEVLDGSFTVPEKIKGFQMNAPEESDEDGHANRNATAIHSHIGNIASTSQGKITDKKISKLDIGIKSISTILTTKAEANTQSSASSVFESSANNNSGFNFSVGPAASILSEAGTLTVKPFAMMKFNSDPVTETAIPIFNFGSGSTRKGPVFSFSTSGCIDVDFTKPNLDFTFESKAEASFSTAVAAAAPASASTVPFQTTSGSSETSVSIFKSPSTLGFSGNLSSPPSVSAEVSLTPVPSPMSSISLFGGSASKADGMNSVSFSFPRISSSTAMITCGNKVEGSILPSSRFFGLTNASGSISSNTSGISNSTTNLLPNSQSAFTGSLFGQASSFGPVATSAPLVFGTSMFSALHSNSLPSASLFPSNSSLSCGGTSHLLFGSTSSTTASGSTSSFGSTAPSLSSSASFPSFAQSGNSYSSNISATFDGSTAASDSDTSSTFCAAINPSLGFSGTSITGSSAPTFSASSTPRLFSDTAASFGLCTTPQFASSASSLFGYNTSLSVESSSSSFGSGVSPLFGSYGVTVNANDMARSFTSGPAFSFGSGSSSFRGSSPLFGSCSSNSLVLGGSSVAFGSASSSPLSGSSSIFDSSSTPSGGSGSLFGSASTPLFGSSTTPQFGLAQSFGASSDSQSTMPLFGSGFGGSPALASSGFASSGGSTAASSSSFAIGTMGSTSSGTTFSNSLIGASPGTFTFGSKDMCMSPQQSMFGLTNTSPTFCTTSPSTPTDQMEDIMTEDPVQISPAPVFGGQSASPGTSFMFASQSSAPLPGQSVFQFGAQPSPPASPFAASVQSTFNNSTGGLEFSGGRFSVGGVGEKPGCKFIKAKRDRGRRK